MLLDISPNHLKIVQDILRKYLSAYEVWAFGSRAKWLAKEYSDLDLCVISQYPISFNILGLLEEAFNDSDLPYKVDIVDWSTTSASFREIIKKDKVVVQKIEVMNGEWVETTLGELIVFSNGRTSPERFENGVYSVFGSNGLIGNTNEFNTPSNTIVIGRVGSYCGAVHFSEKPCWVTDNAIKAFTKEENNPKFLFYLLKNLNLNTWRSGSGQPLINQATLNAIKVSVPKPREQKEIAAILSSLDDRITLLRETNKTLEAIAQALFKSWFIDFDPVRAKMENKIPEGMDEETAALFPDSLEESELGMIPKGWKVAALDEIANFLNGLALQKFPPQENEWLPVIKIAQLRKGDTVGADKASSNLKKEYIVQNGDVLFSWSGSLEVEIWCGGDGALNQHLFKVTSSQFPKWFYYYWTRKHLASFRETAASKATTMGHIQRGHLSAAKVFIPTNEIIFAATKILEPLVEMVIKNKKQAQTLANLRDTLLPGLISGQIRV